MPHGFDWQEQNPHQALPEYLASLYPQLNGHTACHYSFWGMGSPNIYDVVGDDDDAYHWADDCQHDGARLKAGSLP